MEIDKSKWYFSFMNPILKLIDSGWLFRKPVSWLYYFMAILNLLSPIILLIVALKLTDHSDLHKFKVVFFGILALGIVVIFAWASFLFWIKRATQLLGLIKPYQEFVAFPVMAHFTKTFGEWQGLYLGIGGSVICILLSLTGIEDVSFFFLLGIPACILYGYLNIFFSRTISEFLNGFASIANNMNDVGDIVRSEVEN